jgi:hypothetical protein
MRHMKTPWGAQNKIQLLAGVAFAAATLCVAPSSWAQTQPEPAATSDDSGEIVVTAQRRAESLEDVPISIANVSSEMLENNSLGDVMSLPQAVPSLRITRAGWLLVFEPEAVVMHHGAASSVKRWDSLEKLRVQVEAFLLFHRRCLPRRRRVTYLAATCALLQVQRAARRLRGRERRDVEQTLRLFAADLRRTLAVGAEYQRQARRSTRVARAPAGRDARWRHGTAPCRRFGAGAR